VSTKKYKLAIIATHVIQYAIPLYKKISVHPDIELTVFFCSEQGLKPKLDSGFGVKFKWDTVDLDGLNYKFLNNYSPLPNPSNFFGLINPGIINELSKNRYDAILIGGYYLFSYWLAIYASYITKTPFILTGEPPILWRSKIRILTLGMIKKIFMPKLLDKASAILYIGKKSKDYYLSFRKDIGDKLFFSPYSVDNDLFFKKSKELQEKKDQIKQELGIPLGYPVILFLSKLIKWKRPLFLLEVFKQLKIPASLVFVGSGYRLNALKKYVKRNGLKRVFFFGFQNYSQVSKFYSIADIFTLPSLGESWGLVINEAMCFGLPIVTTDKVMAAYDLVQPEKNGYILPANDEKSFVDALEYLLNHPQERERMGRASIGLIKEWNYDCYIEGLLAALKFIKNK